MPLCHLVLDIGRPYLFHDGFDAVVAALVSLAPQTSETALLSSEYFTAFLKDPEENCVEAVYHHGSPEISSESQGAKPA